MAECEPTDMADYVQREVISTQEVLAQLAHAHTRQLAKIYTHLRSMFHDSGTLFICGNGGSAALSQHIASELVGRIASDRIPLPAMALTADTAVVTSIANDYGYPVVFSRQLQALARQQDTLLAMSTSGRSPSIINALQTACRRGVTTVTFCGPDTSSVRQFSDHLVSIPSNNTACIQQAHLVLLHALCRALEDAYIDGGPGV